MLPHTMDTFVQFEAKKVFIDYSIAKRSLMYLSQLNDISFILIDIVSTPTIP